ncbi:MAG: O-antigen ligase family protein [Paludibacteraceae bacterium]|nr:O-antigen ligase family protein [Paludibacteraceae bacterium]
MSITEIVVLLFAPRLLVWMTRSDIPHLKSISWWWGLMFVFQCVSEFVVNNSFHNAARGLMVTVMAYLLFLFFLRLLSQNVGLIIYGVAAEIVALILFGDQFGFAEDNEGSYFKFYIAPLVSYAVCFIVLRNSVALRKYHALLFLLLGIFCMAGGSRSWGVDALLTGLLLMIYRRNKNIKIRRLVPTLLIVACVFEAFYVFVYIPNIKKGEWGVPYNDVQMRLNDYSANPVDLLLTARYDFALSWKAFMEKPWFGHGAWAKDKTLQYAKLSYKKEQKPFHYSPSREYLIPFHSVLLSRGSSNGVFVFVIFVGICVFYYAAAIRNFKGGLRQDAYLLFNILVSLQQLFFGPAAQLKNVIALSFALFMAIEYRKNKELALVRSQECTA